jgi:hypothetical protein
VGAAILGELVVVSCEAPQRGNVDRAELARQRTLGRRDRVVGRRFDHQSVALVVNHDCRRVANTTGLCRTWNSTIECSGADPEPCFSGSHR